MGKKKEEKRLMCWTASILLVVTFDIILMASLSDLLTNIIIILNILTILGMSLTEEKQASGKKNYGLEMVMLLITIGIFIIKLIK